MTTNNWPKNNKEQPPINTNNVHESPTRMLTYMRRSKYGLLFFTVNFLLLFPLLQWRVLLQHSTLTTTHTTPRFAYAFLVAGCNPDRPAYRPFLYNIAVATRLLSHYGSHAHVIVLIQMDVASPQETLPAVDLQLLQSSSLKVHIHYIPKTPFQSYYRTQFDKFRILQYTQYEQGILFMDADVMPLTNLDYLFSIIKGKPNWVVAGPIAPANGGFFLLRPTPGAFEQVAALLFEQTSSSSSDHTTAAGFDPIQGWGHAFGSSDYWETRSGNTGREWTFYAAHADQGFLYHWVKYVQQNVTIVVGPTVQNWGCCDANGQVQLEGTISLLEINAPTRREPPPTCWSPPGKDCLPIYGDHVHFGGRRKPWLNPPPKNLSRATRWESPIHLWYWTLMEVNAQLGRRNNWTTSDDWVLPQDPPLGLKPGKRQAFRGPPIQLLSG